MKSQSDDSFVLTWHSESAEGFADILPQGTFRERKRHNRFVHFVRSPRGRLSTATCTVSVGKRVARLNYNPFEAENTAAGMELGEMRILFEDDNRSQIATIEWAEGTTGDFSEADITREVEAAVRWPSYNPTSGRSPKKLRRSAERPGQAAFRAQLMIVYGSRCCISGCNVAEALEGAHIDPYENPTHNSPQNGVLLRRDLHALFDANLLTISPQSNVVLIASRLRSSTEYARFDQKPLFRPASGFESVAPDRRALRRRYDCFEG